MNRPGHRIVAWLAKAALKTRTPDASRRPGVSEPREASGVRPIYRRFPSGAGRPAVRGPNARHQSRGSFPLSLKRVAVISSNRGFSKDSSPEIEPHYPDCCEIAGFSDAFSVAERVDRGLENRQVRFEKLLIVFPAANGPCVERLADRLVGGRADCPAT